MGTGAGLATGFALVVLFAIAVVVVGTAGLFIKIGASIVRALFGGTNSTSRSGRYIVCKHRGCEFENRGGARFCAQCGRPLWRTNQG